LNAERPGDLYSHIARMVDEKVNLDAADPESKYHEISKKL